MLESADLETGDGLTESDLHYTFTCPKCSGNFSILLERIPPVQARFRCPHCQQPMDFPSREEARVYARLQAEAAAADPPPAADPPKAAAAPAPPARAFAAVAPDPFAQESADSAAGQKIRVEKPGFESDEFDRRGIRNLIRTGEVAESDLVSVDGAAALPAGQVPFLKSLFKLRSTSSAAPPTRCRTHTDKLAFYKCQETARPLCEECAPERKFGNATTRVCSHCGGTIQELAPPA